MHKKIFLLALIVFLLKDAASQDLHFSHFFNTPLQINPANTGRFDGAYRLGLDYKSQWNSFVRGYATFSAFGDYKFIRNPKSRDQLSAGIVFFNDKAGTGELGTSKVFASLAYHRTFGMQRDFRIGVGLGGGLVQKSLDLSDLIFDRQWTDDGFDPSSPHDEPLSNGPALRYFDFSGGLTIEFLPSSDFQLNAGASILHTFTPSESFYGNLNEIGTKPTLHAGSYIQVANWVHLEPAIFYTRQKAASEFLYGANIGLHLQAAGDPVFLAGAWLRNVRDIIPVVGVDYKQFRVFGSYDVNVSPLETASELKGGLEFSIIYTGDIQSKLERVVIPCTRF